MFAGHTHTHTHTHARAGARLHARMYACVHTNTALRKRKIEKRTTCRGANQVNATQLLLLKRGHPISAKKCSALRWSRGLRRRQARGRVRLPAGGSPSFFRSLGLTADTSGRTAFRKLRSTCSEKGLRALDKKLHIYNIVVVQTTASTAVKKTLDS